MASKNTNFTNPDSLIYQNDLLKLTFLGGIKLDGLDRMRSTLKIELKDPENNWARSSPTRAPQP